MEEKLVNIKQEIAVLTEGSDMIVCETRTDYELLCKQEDLANNMKKQVLEYWDGTKQVPGPIPKAYSLWKDLTEKRGAMVKPLDTFLATCRRVGGGFLALEQKREQDRLDALRREAEAIRARQEAEAAKQAEELRQKQVAERRAAEEAFKNSPAELAKAKARMEAEQAEARRRQEEEAKARMVDTTALPTKAEKVETGEGRTVVQTWTFDIDDEALIPRQFLSPNLTAIKAMVTALKDKANIPGVKVRMETSVRRTGK